MGSVAPSPDEIVPRLDNWPARLAAEVNAWNSRAFVWGMSDCLALCIACEHAITGQTRFAGLPAYFSEAGALRWLKRQGYASIEQAVDERLTPIAVAQARRGDWIMREAASMLPGAFGVVLGEEAAHMGSGGLMLVPVAGSKRAWRV